MMPTWPSPHPAGPSHERQALLNRYWGQDRWDLSHPFFDPFRKDSSNPRKKVLDFSRLPPGIKEEFKYFLAHRLEHRALLLSTACRYSSSFRYLADFFARSYPTLSSLTALSADKVLLHWRTFLM